MSRVSKSGNQNILKEQNDFFEIAKSALKSTPDIPDIVTFAEHSDFLGRRLYPRQKTLLKLINLEIENMTDYDLEVIDEWTKGFDRSGVSIGVCPDIWDRVEYLKANGYSHFREVVNITGRRGGKGHIGGIQGAYLNWKLLMLDDPQWYYGIDKSKDIYLFCVATNIEQAKRYQFADLANTIIDAPCFQPYVAKANEYLVALRTPSDVRRIAAFEARGIRPQRMIASVRNMAVTSNSKASRGAAAFGVMFDEFAHMLVGTAGPRTSDEVYNAITPALDQFGKDGFIYIPTSPFCLVPSTLVLTEDLRWVPVGSLKVGDKLIGFDEYAPGGKGNGRSWRQAVVEETSIINAPTYRLNTDRATPVECTGEHLWLTKRAIPSGYEMRWEWVKTKDLKSKDRIRYMPKWEDGDPNEMGYLGGFFDGEGWLSGALGVGQNAGPVLDYVLELLDKYDYNYSLEYDEDHYYGNLNFTGGSAEVMRFLGTTRPRRLMNKFHNKFYGTRAYDKTSQYVEVESIEFIGDQDVVALGTSTSTLIAEGMFSHNTKVGKCFELYENALQLNEDGTPAFPDMMMAQLPSWGPYEDWQDPKATGGFQFRGAPQTYDDAMIRLEKREPDAFKVERLSQWAEVTDAYLNAKIVERMYEPFKDVTGELRYLEEQKNGTMGFIYRGHCDPSKSNANTAAMICHVEAIPDPEDGEVWFHVIVDWQKVWNPEDYDEHQVDYEEIEEELVETIARYNTLKVFSFDQYGGFVTLPRLKKRLKEIKHKAIVKEEQFQNASNDRRAERFKSALGMNWVHSYKDQFGTDGTCLLEQELKFLQEVNGRVKKQDFGPVQTKDLADCLMVCVDQLLEDNFIKLEMRDKLSNTNLYPGSQGGYHTGNAPLSARDKLRSFGASKTNNPYPGMAHRRYK